MEASVASFNAPTFCCCLMKKLHAPFDRAEPLVRSNTPKTRIFFVYLTQMARRASNRRPQTTLQASFADAAALGSVRTDITEAEMEENRRRAGLPDNWMDLPLRFGPSGFDKDSFLQSFADALNTAKATNSPLILDFTPPVEKLQPPHWAKVVKAVERECIQRQLKGVCLMASAMAARFIPSAKMVLGYMTVPVNGILKACTHCWLELEIAEGHDAIRIDIGNRVTRHWQKLYGISRGRETYYLSRSDVPTEAAWSEENHESEKFHATFALYQQDPESYFRIAPAQCKWIQEFHP
jgi:hypothetical protein